MVDRGLDLVVALAVAVSVPAIVGFDATKLASPAAKLLPSQRMAWPLAATGSVLLVLKEVARRRIDREGLESVTTNIVLDYEACDPEDPQVKRLIRDRIEEKASFPEADTIDIVDDTLGTAVFLGASDIHLEAKAKQVRLSFRIDGILTDIAQMPKNIHQALVNRMKIMSQLDISKTDVPQDGRLSSRIRGKSYNMRISSLPTLHGETVVIRILGSTKKVYGLGEFGIQPEVLDAFRRVLHAPQGIVLFTGPTGSGKTSLMYAALREILVGEQAKRNICTLEDPIEQDLEDINQSQIDSKKGVTFAVGLRSLLRQDPDIIMVGEIRDLETAKVALQAGQTGHMIISTVHANSAAGAFARLMDMGLEPFLLASSISGVVAQRLVRRLCEECRVERPPSAELLKTIGCAVLPEGLRAFEAPGCPGCDGTGFRGRMAIFEFVRVSESISNAVMTKGTTQDLVRAARRDGMLSLLEDGLIKVGQGKTSLEELSRVVVG